MLEEAVKPGSAKDSLCYAPDVQEVARGIGLDNRIGPQFLHPGPRFGGRQCAFALPEAITEVNDTRKRTMARKVSGCFAGCCAAGPLPCSD
jgi:UDP-glucose 6-dehydrogenase